MVEAPTATAQADLIIDCFGIMHERDQAAALHEPTPGT
jgi:hypothetical protein